MRRSFRFLSRNEVYRVGRTIGWWYMKRERHLFAGRRVVQRVRRLAAGLGKCGTNSGGLKAVRSSPELRDEQLGIDSESTGGRSNGKLRSKTG